MNLISITLQTRTMYVTSDLKFNGISSWFSILVSLQKFIYTKLIANRYYKK